MKKLLFIALLSLVTLGAKAYDVLFVNDTHLSNFSCSIIFRWGSSINPTTVAPGSSSQLFTGITEYATNLPVYTVTSIACCSPNSQQSNHVEIDNTTVQPPTPTPYFLTRTFYLNKCVASASWTVTIAYFSLTDRFVVTIY